MDTTSRGIRVQKDSMLQYIGRTYANLYPATKLIVQNTRMRIVLQVHTRLALLRYYEPKIARK